MCRLGDLRTSLQCLEEAGRVGCGSGDTVVDNQAVTHLNICALLSKLKR
jgi:hypothetical protein